MSTIILSQRSLDQDLNPSLDVAVKKFLERLFPKGLETYIVPNGDMLVSTFYDKGIQFNQMVYDFVDLKNCDLNADLDGLEFVRQNNPPLTMIIISNLPEEKVRELFPTLEPFEFIAWETISNADFERMTN